MKFRTACQDCKAGDSAEKCLSQGQNRMAGVGFQQEHVDYNHGALTTRPCCGVFTDSTPTKTTANEIRTSLLPLQST